MAGLDTSSIAVAAAVIPLGVTIPFYGGPNAIEPAGFKFTDGQDISNKIHLKLLQLFETANTHGQGPGTALTSVDNSTDTLNLNSHGLVDDDVVTLSTSGTMPAGLIAGDIYFVVNATANDFQVALTKGGSFIDFTDNGTGTHSFHTTFCVPDERGYTIAGMDDMGTAQGARNVVTNSTADSLGGELGAENHILSTSEIPAHDHEFQVATVAASGAGANSPATGGGTFSDAYIEDTGGGGSHNNMQPTKFAKRIIRVL